MMGVLACPALLGATQGHPWRPGQFHDLSKDCLFERQSSRLFKPPEQMNCLEFSVCHFLQKHRFIIRKSILKISHKIPLLLVNKYLPELKSLRQFLPSFSPSFLWLIDPSIDSLIHHAFSMHLLSTSLPGAG